MDKPQLFGNSSMSFLATRTQKMAIGAEMRKTVSPIDLTSGPNISLPPQRNICKNEQSVSSPRPRNEKRIKALFQSQHNEKSTLKCSKLTCQSV